MGGLSVAKYEGKSGGGDAVQRDFPKKGPRLAQLVGIVDVGIHVQEYQGEKKKPCRELIPIFKLLQDKYTDEDGKEHCMTVSPYFGLGIMPGAERSKYMKFCEAIDPEHEVLEDGAGELVDLLGRYCYVNIKHNTKKNEAGEDLTYGNYVNISQLPEDYPIPEHEEFEKIFFDTMNPDASVFEKLHGRQKELIESMENFETSKVKVVCGDNVGGQVDTTKKGEDEDEDGKDDDCPY